ncbi:MAG: nucleotidyl transferase AbiEii/AbiGii toxin family protein [Anaerolineales bacterium]
MREYASPAAFRAAVDTRLRNYARKAGIPVQVVRRQAALERLMARLAHDAPRRWALKGGLALDTRLGQHARPSMDMDLDHVEGAAAARDDLQRASALDLKDHFAFALIGTEQVVVGGDRLAVRYRIEASLAGVPFEVIQIDVTVTAPEFWQVEPAQRTGLLAAVGLGPIEVMLVPLERQVAEKLHAYTRRYNGGSTRVRDLVDFVVICLFEVVNAKDLREEITRIFARRDTHAVPDKLPAPPADWTRSYGEEARAIGIPEALTEGYSLFASWLDPVLQGRARGTWNPKRQAWVRR